MREWPTSRQSTDNGDNKAKSFSVAPLERVSPKGTTSATGGRTNHLYSLNNCQDQDDSPDIVTGII